MDFPRPRKSKGFVHGKINALKILDMIEYRNYVSNKNEEKINRLSYFKKISTENESCKNLSTVNIDLLKLNKENSINKLKKNISKVNSLKNLYFMDKAEEKEGYLYPDNPLKNYKNRTKTMGQLFSKKETKIRLDKTDSTLHKTNILTNGSLLSKDLDRTSLNLNLVNSLNFNETKSNFQNFTIDSTNNTQYSKLNTFQSFRTLTKKNSNKQLSINHKKLKSIIEDVNDHRTQYSKFNLHTSNNYHNKSFVNIFSIPNKNQTKYKVFNNSILIPVKETENYLKKINRNLKETMEKNNSYHRETNNLNEGIEDFIKEHLKETKNFFSHRDVMINLSKQQKLIIPVNKDNIISKSFLLSKLNDDTAFKFKNIMKTRFGDVELNNDLTVKKKEVFVEDKVPLIDFSDPLEGKMAKSIIKASEFFRMKTKKRNLNI